MAQPQLATKLAVAGPSKQRKARKEPVYDLTTARARQHDQELKRSRGEIACLECCRLKLKCDKKIPCGACVRRGCGTRCPNGISSTSPPSKYVLLNSECLNAKVDEMACRIRQLEDALAISYSEISAGSHPLLEEFPDSKGSPKKNYDTLEVDPQIGDGSIVDFGMLLISDSGGSRFTGRSGGDEILLVNGLNKISTGEKEYPHTKSTFQAPPPIWPFTSTQPGIVDRLRHLLPPKERTIEICGRYLEQSSWQIRWVKRQQFFEEVVPFVYGEPLPPHIPPPKGKAEIAHTFALLFMMLAHGLVEEIHETTDEHGNSDKFHQCAMCLLNLESVAESPTLTTVQVLGLMGMFLSYHCNPNSEYGRALLNLASSISITIGLHRDPGMWDLEPRIMERRREVFWQMQTVLSWISIVSGRPGPCSLRFVDCGFPTEEGELDAQGNDVSDFWLWRYKFIKEILHPIHELICSAGALKYSDVVTLDHKVREFELPKQLKPSANEDEDAAPFFIDRKFLPVVMINTALLLLHRMFFTKAMLDHPSDPMQSKYAPSFLSAYRTSLSTVKYAREYLKRYPRMLKRSWMVWKHTFSALIMLGTVVARGPSSIFAPPAFIELAMGMELLEQVGKEAKWADRYLAVLRPLRERAYEAYDGHRNGEVVSPGSEGQKEVERQIAIFGGHTLSLTMGRKESESKSPSPALSIPQPISPPPVVQPLVTIVQVPVVVPPSMGNWYPPEMSTASPSSQFMAREIKSQPQDFSTYFQYPSIFSNTGPTSNASGPLPPPPQPDAIKLFPFKFDDLFNQGALPTDVTFPDFADAMVFGSGDGKAAAGNQADPVLMDQGWTDFMQELGF